MATIAIEKTDLIGAEQLAAFLERRMAVVMWLDAQNELAKETLAANTIDAYVCSQFSVIHKAGSLLLLKSHEAEGKPCSYSRH